MLAEHDSFLVAGFGPETKLRREKPVRPLEIALDEGEVCRAHWGPCAFVDPHIAGDLVCLLSELLRSFEVACVEGDPTQPAKEYERPATVFEVPVEREAFFE